MLLQRSTSREWRKTHQLIHTVWLAKAFHPSRCRLLTPISIHRIHWRALDNIPNHDRVQFSRPCNRKCSLGEICYQRLRHAPPLLGWRASLACCETNARQSFRRHLCRWRFPPATLPRTLFPSFFKLFPSLLISPLHLLIQEYLAVDVHTRNRLRPRRWRYCSKPHAHSTSSETLLRCVTASHYL